MLQYLIIHVYSIYIIFLAIFWLFFCVFPCLIHLFPVVSFSNLPLNVLAVTSSPTLLYSSWCDVIHPFKSQTEVFNQFKLTGEVHLKRYLLPFKLLQLAHVLNRLQLDVFGVVVHVSLKYWAHSGWKIWMSVCLSFLCIPSQFVKQTSRMCDLVVHDTLWYGTSNVLITSWNS